jgi:DNA-binding NarL/FixJ family response regulator
MTVAARILVVDDTPANVRLLEAVLAPEGYDVRVAGSGAEALAVIAADPPDLVLLDVLMPEMGGHEVCARLRAAPETEALPILMITAGGEQQRLTALEGGADDFVAKPFDRAELLARVRSLVRIARYRAAVETQARQLAELNRTLEERVAEQVRTIQRLDGLRRFLPRQLADLMLSSGDERALESHRAEIALVCVRLHGFPRFAERAAPEELMHVLREFHDRAGRAVGDAGATVGSLSGDAVTVYFNDPLPCDDPAWEAVVLAATLREVLGRSAAGWRGRGHDLHPALGVALDHATVGRIGFEGRWDYAPVGPVVQTAARLADAAAPGEILLDARCHAEVGSRVVVEPVGDSASDGGGATARVALRAIQGIGGEGLTAREMDVVRLLAEGHSNRGIADRLVISEKTVIRHVSNIFAKLGVHNRTEAARTAAERGLLAP